MDCYCLQEICAILCHFIAHLHATNVEMVDTSKTEIAGAKYISIQRLKEISLMSVYWV